MIVMLSAQTLALLSLLPAVQLSTASPLPTPPNIPAASTARSELASLTVAASGSLDGYSRDEFPHWITISGKCDTRETVLKRDGTDVVQASDCSANSGTWVSPYDGATWTASSDVDIDHLVPLANAWVSGASSWTTAQRQSFANDLTNPQLLAVTDNVNESKGDRSPDEWKPPLSECTSLLHLCNFKNFENTIHGRFYLTYAIKASFYCEYARMWCKVKTVYSLTITSAEKSALSSMLDTC